MRKLFGIFLVLLFLSKDGLAQVALEDVVIEPKIVDLGTLAEENGQIFAKFKFKVTGKTALKLRNVTAGCGCTNVTFTPGIYQPGDSGIVKLKFNPSGLLGPVTREIWMEGNFKLPVEGIGKSVLLQAVVYSKLANTDGSQKYLDNRQFQSGDLSFSRNQLYYGVHKPNFKRTDTIYVKNNNQYKTYDIKGIDRNPFFLNIKNTPIQLAPGDSLPLHFELNLEGKDTFGELYGRFRIITNDKSYKFKETLYYVKIDAYLGTPTKKALRKSPKINIKNTVIDFGDVKTGGKLTRFVEITNEGKSTLNIWRADTDCVCVKLGQVKFEIPPGESRVLEVTFDTILKTGKQNKQIKLYTNDPRNKEILLSAIVNISK